MFSKARAAFQTISGSSQDGASNELSRVTDDAMIEILNTLASATRDADPESLICVLEGIRATEIVL